MIGRRLAAAAAILGAVGLATAPQPAHALGTGAAVGIGLGAFALGTHACRALLTLLLPERLLRSASGLLLRAAGGLLSALLRAAQLLEPILPDLRRLLGSVAETKGASRSARPFC